MLEGPLVFLDIDTQRDFLEPTGALYISGSAAILSNLRRMTAFARRLNIPVIATACAHHSDDPELKIFPPHCIVGTSGQKRMAETAFADSVVLDLDETLTGELPSHLTLWKRELDLFSRTDADDLITRYDRNKPTFVVFGVATDYCVARAVEGLLSRQCRVSIAVDAVRAIDPTVEPALLTRFARKGACLTLTERIAV